MNMNGDVKKNYFHLISPSTFVVIYLFQLETFLFGALCNKSHCAPLQGVCLQPQAWRRWCRKAEQEQEGSCTTPPPSPPAPPTGGSTTLSNALPPLWRPRHGRFTSSKTGRSTNEWLERRRSGLKASQSWRGFRAFGLEARGAQPHAGMRCSWRDGIFGPEPSWWRVSVFYFSLAECRTKLFSSLIGHSSSEVSEGRAGWLGQVCHGVLVVAAVISISVFVCVIRDAPREQSLLNMRGLYFKYRGYIERFCAKSDS